MNPREAADFLAGLVRTPDTRTNVERRALNILIDHARATSPEGGDWGWPSDPWAHFTGEYIAKATEEGRFTDADIDVIADLMAHADQSRPTRAPSAAAPPREDDEDDERPMSPSEKALHDAYYDGAGTSERSHDEWAQRRGFNSSGELHAWVDAQLAGTARDPERAT